jgi:phosphoadenosine phosphosulfate reductase
VALVEHRLFETVDKVQVAIDRLREHEPPEGYYLAFSGGKDSQAIYHLAEHAGVKFDAHYHNTTVDPPELLRFIRHTYPDVRRHQPEKSMWKIMREHGYPPTRMVRYCCEELKEVGGEGRVVVTGVRAAESPRRKQWDVVAKCRYNKNKTLLNPILEWTDADVWEYLGNRKHCELYDEGFRRIGCIGCPLHPSQRTKDFERWPRFARKWKKTLGQILDRRHSEGRMMQWKTVDDIWSWWMEEKHTLSDSNQLEMFD